MTINEEKLIQEIKDAVAKFLNYKLEDGMQGISITKPVAIP